MTGCEPSKNSFSYTAKHENVPLIHLLSLFLSLVITHRLSLLPQFLTYFPYKYNPHFHAPSYLPVYYQSFKFQNIRFFSKESLSNNLPSVQAMAISKTLIAPILISLLLLHLAESYQKVKIFISGSLIYHCSSGVLTNSKNFLHNMFFR